MFSATMPLYMLLVVAGIPFVYYLIAIYSSFLFFSQTKQSSSVSEVLPPVSVLKPIRGLDPESYENFASFCKQDYPAPYEILFCVDADDPALPVIQRLKHDFPQRSIRLLVGSDHNVVNDKVGRLIRLTQEAHYDLFVITDGDVRVKTDYLRSVVRPFADPKIGAATCFYVSTKERSLIEKIQSISMISDFFAGIIVAWKLEGVKFALAQTIVTRRRNISDFGGFEALKDRPADDLYVGRLVAEQGFTTVLLPQVVETVPDFANMPQFLQKRARWMTVMRHIRPAGHFGLLFTWGLPWSLIAIALHPTLVVALIYLGTYLGLRIAMTWLIGVHGMRQAGVWTKMFLIPVWDMMAFALWVFSFGKTRIQWRGVNYRLQNGKLTLIANGSMNCTRNEP